MIEQPEVLEGTPATIGQVLKHRAEHFHHQHGNGDGLGYYGRRDEQLDRQAAAEFELLESELAALRGEIERLTEALVSQTSQHAYPCSPLCAGYLREQAAVSELAPLRERVRVLEEIVIDWRSTPGNHRSHAWWEKWNTKVERAALQESKDDH